jgi:thiol:disulfide interchange protein DsbD
VIAAVIIAAICWGSFAAASEFADTREERQSRLYLLSAVGEHWEPWTADAVSKYQSQGTPVFVDFTAKWCLSCQVNERVALTRPEVMKAFADSRVALMKADWTQHDDAISQTLEKLGRSGVPVYALYVPGQATPRLLPEALTPGIVLDAINSLPRNSTQTAAAPSKR